MFEVTVTGSKPLADQLKIRILLLPWTGMSAGQEMEPARRWALGLDSPRDWVYGRQRELQHRPDPAGGGIVGKRSRVTLPWFPIEEDGTSLQYPLLASITSLAVNRFSGEQLPALLAEIGGIKPHLTPADAAAFAGFAFVIDEVRRVGHGTVELTPL
jgi:hypothetical protein